MTEDDGTDKVNPGAVVRRPGSSMENKTGSWRSSRPVAVEGKCTGCGICTWYCPDSAIKIVETKDRLRPKDLSQATSGRKRTEIDYDYCKGCMLCVSECPAKAIESRKEGEE